VGKKTVVLPKFLKFAETDVWSMDCTVILIYVMTAEFKQHQTKYGRSHSN